MASTCLWAVPGVSMAFRRAFCSRILINRPATTFEPDSMTTTLLFQTRSMAGGPRNPEHKRRNLSPEEKKERAAKQWKAREQTKKPPAVKQDLSKHMKRPIPEKLHPYIPAMETYIVQEWLPSFPEGARLRKLQRDVAWRMNRKQSPGKLDYEAMLPIVGKLLRKGLIDIRQNKNGSLVILSPSSKKQGQREGRENSDASKPTESSGGAKGIIMESSNNAVE